MIMASTREAVHERIEELDECLFQQEEIWEAFAREHEKKARVLCAITELALSLSDEQAVRLDESWSRGIAARELTNEQREFLVSIEPRMRELGLLDEEEGQRLAQSTVVFLANGQMWFGWGELPHRSAVGLSWLPETVYGSRAAATLVKTLEVWRERKLWLMEEHAADARRAARRCRRVFQLVSGLSPEQIAWMVERDGLPVAALHPEQRALLEAATHLHPRYAPTDALHSFISFDLRGQFWLIHRGRTQTSRCGMAWLPYSWHREERKTPESLRGQHGPVHQLHGASARAELCAVPPDRQEQAADSPGDRELVGASR